MTPELPFLSNMREEVTIKKKKKRRERRKEKEKNLIMFIAGDSDQA